jgi:aminopeptidase N
MYTKGALMLHTLRNVIDHVSLWFSILRGIQEEFKYQSITTEDLVSYFNLRTGKDFTPFFDQYLRHTELPALYLSTENRNDRFILKYRWEAAENFGMPVNIFLAEDRIETLQPTSEWRELTIKGVGQDDIVIEQNRYFIEVIWE